MVDTDRNGRGSDSYTLYATNLPQELDENGIKNVFNKFGTVTGIIVLNDFAYVSYSTYAEAEAAIVGLDNKPPLELRVEFRRKKPRENGSSVPNHQESSISSTPTKVIHAMDHRYDYSESPRCLNSRPEIPLRHLPPEMSPYYYNYPKSRPVHPSVYDHYDDIKYPETNALWSRGNMMIDASGQRYVSMGRGYTHYHIPDPFPGIEDQLNRVYEHRTSGSYVYGKDNLHNQIEKCFACSKNALYNCKSCDASYCSRECQITDWPQHKNQCIIPPLVQTLKTEPERKDAFKSTVNKNSENNHDEKLPRTFKLIVNDKIKKVDLASRLEHSRKSVQVDGDFLFKRNENTFLSAVDYDQVQIVVVHKYGLLSVQKTCDLKKWTEMMEKLMLMSENLENATHPIAGKTYATVNDGIWHRVVILDSPPPLRIDYIDYGTVEEMTDTIDLWEIGELANIPRFSRIIRILPKLQDKYKNLSEGESIQVRMIDVDNDGVINVDILDREFDSESSVSVSKDRPKKLVHIEAMPKPLKQPRTNVAATILENKIEQNETIRSWVEKPRASPAKKIEISPVKKIEVTPAKKIEVTPAKKVEVSPVKESPVKKREFPQVKKLEFSPVEKVKPSSVQKVELSSTKQIQNLPNILEVLKKGVNQVIAEITEKINDNSVVAAILFDEVQDNYSQMMDPLKNDCDAIQSQYPDCKPEVNDLVCALTSLDGYWRRSRVLSISPELKIASLDEGIMLTADKIIPIPPKYSKIYSFSVVLSAEPNVKFPESSPFTFKVFKKLEDSELILDGELETDNGLKIQIKNWDPITTVPENNKEESPEKDSIRIKNGSKVAIQSFRSTSILYVRSLDDQEVERFHRVNQDTAKAALISIDLKSYPAVGEYVLAQFIDENYYRGIVLEVDEPKIKINYIDFGNNEVTTLDKLKMMPTEIKKEPGCVIKISLKGIKDVPPNEKSITYLKTICDQETLYTFTYEDSFITNVTLTDVNGKTVNEVINELLTPDWQKDKKSKSDEDYLQLEHMEVGKLGKIGETVEAYFISALKPGSKYVFASMDPELITHISNVLPGLMMDYCTKTEFYIPRNNELCIAKYDSEWYRGCCIKPSLTPASSEIYFLDYGNIGEVKHQDIRMMHKDFLKPSALGLICNTSGFVSDNKNPSEELLEKLNNILISNEIYSVKVLKYEDGEWTVELPEIKKKLIQEGLITS